MFTAPWTFDSASIRKFALVTTRSFSLQAALHFVDVAVFRPELHEARLQSASAFVHENNVAQPVGITAPTGIVKPSPMSIASSAFTYIPGRSLKSGLGISIRTRAVRFAAIEKRID